MQNFRKILKFVVVFVTFVVLLACRTVPPNKDKETDTKIQETLTFEKHKKMNKIEFGLLVQSFLKKGNYDDAIALFSNEKDVEEAVLKDESTKMLHLSVLISANRMKEALSCVEKLEKEYPNNVEPLYCRVMIAQSNNDQKTKNAYLEKILEKYPNDSWAMIEQGLDLLYSKKNYKSARKKFLLALKHSPNNVEALLGLAKVNYMENNLKDAEKNLNLALKEEKENSSLWIELARVKSETNRMLQAIEDVKKAIELDGDIPGHWLDLGLYYMQIGKKKEAKEAFSRVVELDPSHYMAFIYRAGINDELEIYDEALQDYYKVISLYPSYYFAFEGAGILHVRNEQWDKATYCFKNALNAAPSQYTYAMLYAFCSYKANREKEAKAFIREYIKTMNRNDMEDEYFLTRLFLENTGDSDVNNRVLKIKTKDKTKYHVMMFYLGMFYELANKKIIAQKYYLDVLSAKVPSFIEYKLAKISLDRIGG